MRVLILVLISFSTLPLTAQEEAAIVLPRDLVDEQVSLRAPDKLKVLFVGTPVQPVTRMVNTLTAESLQTDSFGPQLKRLLQSATAVQAQFVPVYTPELSPGKVAFERRNFPQLIRPLCLIGDDRQSLDWVTVHRDRLRSMNAICLVVNVSEEKKLVRLQTSLNVPVVPICASAFAASLGIRHYPLLMTTSGVEQ